MTTLRSGSCPKCQSADVLHNVETADRDALSIMVYEGSGVIPRRGRSFPIRAWVCAHCGYTELYVTEPQALAQSYHRSRTPFPT
jgi:predicted nucleic-acid-binding Zn-ribbon protein